MKRIVKGDRVSVRHDIFRVERFDDPANPAVEMLYAKGGEEGNVLETFSQGARYHGRATRWFAKVLIGEKVKTFRLTSLSKL